MIYSLRAAAGNLFMPAHLRGLWVVYLITKTAHGKICFFTVCQDKYFMGLNIGMVQTRVLYGLKATCGPLNTTDWLLRVCNKI